MAIRSVLARLIEAQLLGYERCCSDKENSMSLETILIIALVVFLLGGGGWYFGRG